MEVTGMVTVGVQRMDNPEAARASAPPHSSESETAAAAKAKPAQPNEEQVQRAVRPERSSPPMQQGVPRFVVDKASKRMVAQIVDESNKVIKQIPAEALMKIAANVREMQGLLFDERS